jgi:hypothetical protein
VVFFFFSTTKKKKKKTPRQSCGTLLRAFFAVRKQSPPQVTPVDGLQPPIPRFAKQKTA